MMLKGMTCACSDGEGVFTYAVNPRESVGSGPHDDSKPYCHAFGPAT